MVLLRSFVPTLATLLLAAGQAGSQGVLIERSEIRFGCKQPGRAFSGRFRKWKANIAFVPEDPAASKADFEIDLGSIDLANDEAETELKRSSWLDTAQFPVAKFISRRVRGTGPDNYEVAGALTLKGITRDTVVPVTVKRDATGNSVAEGSFTLRRLEFDIGCGAATHPGAVANEVTVRVRMVLPAGQTAGSADRQRRRGRAAQSAPLGASRA